MDFLALKESPFPSGIDDEGEIRQHPLHCSSCFNLSARSASAVGVIKGLWKVEFKDVDSTPFAREVSLPELAVSAGSGCVTCKLIRYAIIGFTGGAVAFDSPRLTATLEFAKGSVLRVQIWEKEEAEDEDDEDGLFFFPETQFESGKLIFGPYELYTLPDAPCPWPTIGSSMKRQSAIESAGSNLTEGGPVRHLATHPCSEMGLNTMKRWIDSCKMSHSICREVDASSNRSFPKRVVSLGPSTNDDIHLLDHGGALNKTNPPYVALSYCWGPPPHLRTTADTFEERKANIPFAETPRTFQDAVTITRNLGIQYLWIDALCIIQEDPKDWEVEAAKMASIYGDADLVLSVTESADQVTGFLVDRKPLLKMSGSFPNGDCFGIYGRESTDHEHFGLGSSEKDRQNIVKGGAGLSLESRNRIYQKYALMTRGWCYQERMLASRVLHFTNYEMVYDCATSVDCECGTLLAHEDDLFTPFRRIIKFGDKNTTSHFQHHEGWREMVVHYSHRLLSYETDRLPALAGLAVKWSNKLTGRYLAGLWEDDLFRGLCWWPDEQETVPSSKKEYLGPSWSWVSLRRPVTWGTAPSESTKSYVKFDPDRTECLKDGKHTYSAVDYGCIFLTGTVLEVVPLVQGHSMWLRGALEGPDTHVIGVDHPSCLKEDVEGSQVYCLRLCSKTFTQFAGDDDYALVLVKAGEEDLARLPAKVKQFPNVYRRIGFTQGYRPLAWNERDAGKRMELYLI